MAAPTALILPRDCYTIAQLRRLLAVRDDDGKPVMPSHQAIHYRRIRGTIAWIKFGGTYMYPRAENDAMLQKSNTEMHRP